LAGGLEDGRALRRDVERAIVRRPPVLARCNERQPPMMYAEAQREETWPTLGWDSLSECERRVADLVARGHSNKEIGERLYMSHRTVGSHLYRIFPKLGLRSRVELARIVIERSFSATERLAS
jgi:DNA-binding NarL/FixJ family response regulator